MILVGIEDIDFATGSYVLDLRDLARDLGVEEDKYRLGLGQEMMSVPSCDEDIVTMGAAAAEKLLSRVDKNKIRTLLFATESGIDQSKAAGIYVHKLLNLNSSCRVVELKQACYGATAALQLAASYIKVHPQEKVLIIASDIARYEPRSSAEPTQGCAAVAFVVGNEPKLVALEEPSGIYTEDIMDFWRPNYRQEAFVDGKFSAKAYIHALRSCWIDIQNRFGLRFENFKRFCYHLPFTKMAVKAHHQLLQDHQLLEKEKRLLENLEPSFNYSRLVGNCYSASTYLGLLSLLENAPEDLKGEKLAIFSYGSGCVGELFTATVLEGYSLYLRKQEHRNLLLNRKKIDIEKYRQLLYAPVVKDGSRKEHPHETLGSFRFREIDQHKRLYEKCSPK